MKINISKQIKVNNFLKTNIDKFCSKFHLKLNFNYLNDLENDLFFLNEINKKINSNSFFKKREFNSIYDFSVYRNFLYLLIRHIKPSLIVETGVLHGLTTTWLLKALKDNKKGKLVSIDIKRSDWKKYFKNKKMGPGSEHDLFPDNENPGWIIPDYLKQKTRWKLLYGPSSHYLNKMKNVNLFIHDSDHSFQNVKYETETILRNNKKSNPYIVIDNCDMNSYIFQLIAKYNNKYKSEKLTYSFIDDIDDKLISRESAAIFRINEKTKR